jgi:hypothetical protein
MWRRAEVPALVSVSLVAGSREVKKVKTRVRAAWLT